MELRLIHKKVLLVWLCCVSMVTVVAQSRQDAYIEQYKGMAIQQMNKYGVPASITLAQGLLESGSGMSRLAREANNHFGIKCSGGWTGPYVLANDDAPNEHFRKYQSAEQSFEDHSLFLRRNPRYANLFALSKTDYRGWAYGLKAAGYATNPHYAENLIQLIENYELAQYDTGSGSRRYSAIHGKHMTVPSKVGEHLLQNCNGCYYVVARRGDTFASIAKEMKISERKLRKYNEVDKHYTLQEGEVVFLHKKQSKADKSLKGIWHQVKYGESMHDICQQYAMQMKTLYKINHRPNDYVPQVRDLLLIRR